MSEGIEVYLCSLKLSYRIHWWCALLQEYFSLKLIYWIRWWCAVLEEYFLSMLCALLAKVVTHTWMRVIPTTVVSNFQCQYLNLSVLLQDTPILLTHSVPRKYWYESTLKYQFTYVLCWALQASNFTDMQLWSRRFLTGRVYPCGEQKNWFFLRLNCCIP